jgi:hypothetical protein
MAKRDSNDFISKDDILKLIKRTKVPVLTLDRKWLNFFNNDEKSPEIKVLEQRVNAALKSQGTINTKRDELKGLKKTLMKEIVSNMDAKENSRAYKKVVKSKELIDEINDELILLEDKELDVPDNISQANAMLAYRSLEELYNRYDNNTEDIESLDKWIEDTRIELKKRILLREKRRDENEKMDKFLSDTFDKEVLIQYRKFKDNY